MAYPGQGGPITNQPAAGPPTTTWMSAPPPNSNCPPGLEYLTQVDQLLVHQQVEMFEALVGYETNNKYEIKNSMGQRVYFAAEDTSWCTKNCLGNQRPFEMKICDNTGKEVMHLSSPFRCDLCLCCCPKKIEVQAPPGEVIGYVWQAGRLCKPKFNIMNADNETVMRIDGPCVMCNACGNVEFQVYTNDGQAPVGHIQKQWSGILKEMFTDADNFGITFPMDLDVKVKASLLGALFLIDFMFFEKSETLWTSLL